MQYSQPPVAVAAIYLVNGVNYPVDYAGGIWPHDAWGAWFVIGHIEHTAYGDIAVRNDGMRFAALWVR